MRASLATAGVPTSSATVKRVEAQEVARFTRAADVGLSFREPSLPMRGVCPLKVIEYLLSGVPVIANRGVGDLDALLPSALPDFSHASLAHAARGIAALNAEARSTARQLGLAHFTLDTAARGYVRALPRVT